MTITPIAMFKTSDDKLFYTEEDAIEHELYEEKVVKLRQFLDSNDIYNSYLDSIDIAKILLAEYNMEKK